MATNRAIWYVAGTKKSPRGTLYINCSVKPGASKSREGVTSARNDAVAICVAAQAREGEANKAVVKVLSEVRTKFRFPISLRLVSHVYLQVLGLPKSDLQITQGLKSRNKTIAVVGSWVSAGEEECLARVREYLDKATSDQ